MSQALFNIHDLDAIKILGDFLPDRIFDAHAHLYDQSFMQASKPGRTYTVEDYLRDMSPALGNPKTLRMNWITFPDKSMGDPASGTLAQSDAFLVEQLQALPGNVGEIMAAPGETAEHLASRLVHPGIRGIKCYHNLIQRADTWNAGIGEYLPEGAWELAQEKKLYITLHMVKNNALADPDNLAYIKAMAKRYPDAVLILAHAARSFASWTGVETVGQLAGFENIWYDISGVCESPAIFQIFHKVGKDRVMWGSDYPVSVMRGKAISLADGFYWIYEKDLANFTAATPIHSWLVGIENLMATRQACIMADMTATEVEDLFYNNAARLFDR